MKKNLLASQSPLFAYRSHHNFFTVFFIVIALFLTACTEEDIASKNFTRNNASFAKLSSRLVVTEAYVDINHNLLITGNNFEIGLQDPVVFLEGVSLPFIETPTDEQIIADLSSFPGTDGYFLLTVSAGSDLNENDTHGLLMGAGDPVPFWDQLHIQNNQVIIDEDNNQMEVTIFGFNFDLGYSLPLVSLDGVALTVNEDESDETQIVATGPIPDLSQAEYKLLKVETGTSLEKYDVVVANLPVESEPPTYPPSEGQCTSDEKLCWKEGPWKPSWPLVCLLVDWAVPKYYELTKDYEIDLSEFKAAADVPNSDLIKLPAMANRYGRSIDDYFTLMLDLPEVSFSQHTENGYKWDFISIEKKQTGIYAGYPIIKMKKGYRWDGTTRPCRRFESEFRAGLVHDSMYDLIRIEAIPWKDSYSDSGKRQNDRNERNNRELADMLFYWVSLEDRENLDLDTPKEASDAYYTLQHDGMGRANKHLEKDARWRFHTLADGKVSAGDVDMDIDQEGNKSLTSSCASPDTVIEFDASLSRPLSRSPIKESHYKSDGLEMHETTWQWNLSDEMIVVPKRQNRAGFLLNEGELSETIPLKIMMERGLKLGEENTLSLYIDKGKDPSKRKGYYEKKEDIKIMVNYDSEPPVVNCPENIVAECTGPAGAAVEFEASASDACEGPLVPTCDPFSGATFELGETSTVQCSAEDALENAAQCSFEVAVEDTTPPVITSLSVAPNILWPPNGKLLPVVVSAATTDICDTAPVCSISSIESNEAGDATDSEITGDVTANLRSRRLGTGSGRVYTISVECRDTSGNSTLGTTFVTVPHDQGRAQ